MLSKRFDPEIQMLLNMNDFIHSDTKDDYATYHKAHIDLASQYAIILNHKLGFNLCDRKLMYIAYMHDILKERGLTDKERVYNGVTIPSNTSIYVRNNLNILEKYDLDDYFNTSAQFHALAGGIFLDKELGVVDPEIIYPVMFHSCPIISVYEKLPKKTQRYVDVIILADKLSSNYLKINWKHTSALLDLELAVFGENGKECNYTLGLYLSRKIADKGNEEQGRLAMEYYEHRLNTIMPWINIKKMSLGGNQKWPQRKSLILKTQY